MDDYSRKCWIYLLKNKSDVYNAFIKFHKLMNNTTEFTIKTNRQWNRIHKWKFQQVSFRKWYKINSFNSWLLTTKWSFRRINQTLNNCATTLLNSAKLPLNFWDSAILCACRLYSLNPHQGNNSKIPDEVFFNQPIDISHIRVFGCRVYFYNNHKKNKFENNSKPGIFLGYKYSR